ncbi:MAG: hypothetical protein JXA25_13785 [Anaerolineales bacterium]|nr:hypothetical protein [Anaerolineales bacterium]
MRRMSDLPRRDLHRLSNYLDGGLTPREADALENLVQEDENLQWALEEMRRTRKLLRAVPQLPAPRNFTLTPEMVGTRISRSAPLLRYATAIAMLAFTFTLGTDFLMNMAGGLAASAPAMEAVSNMAAKEAAPLGALEEEAEPMAVVAEENAAGEQMDMQTAPAVDAIPEMEMEEPAEAALLEEEAPVPSAVEEEIQAMEVPAAEHQAAETYAADEGRSIEAPALGGGNDGEEQTLTGEQQVLSDMDEYEAADNERTAVEQEGVEDQAPAVRWAASDETARGGVERQPFLQRLSLLRILEIVTGLTSLILGLIWLRLRKR